MDHTPTDNPFLEREDSFIATDPNSTLYMREIESYLKQVFFNNLSGPEHVDDIKMFLHYIKEKIPTSNLSIKPKEVEKPEDLPYCNFQTVSEAYRRWHWYLSVMVAAIGSFTNILTICILLRKNVFFAINFLLLGIAIADLFVSSEYMPYSVFRIVGGTSLRSSQSVAYYILIRAHFSQVCHTIAIWLTAVLALWRWISVCRPHLVASCCSPYNTKRALIATYLASPVVASPTYLLYSVQETKIQEETIYIVNFSSLVVNSEIIWKVVFFSYSIVVKLLPCIFLTILIPAIINGMLNASRRRISLTLGVEPPTATDQLRSISIIQPKHQRLRRAEAATERTTKMLVVILIIFLIAEVPQGVLTGLTIVYGQSFFKTCYLPLSDVMDLLALCNASVNFVVYCFMSKDFRKAFFDMISNLKKMIKPSCLLKKKEPRPSEINSV